MLTESTNHSKHHAEYSADYRLGNYDEHRAEFADHTLQDHQEAGPLYNSATADFGDS